MNSQPPGVHPAEPEAKKAVSRRQQFPLVQALRALAALSVVFDHVAYNALGLWPQSQQLKWLQGAMPWGAGVDIFFVISGLVILHSSRGLCGTPKAGRRFMARRIARIVPLYWLMTSLFLLPLAIAPGTIHGDIGGPLYILKSYLFIPAARPDGLVQPALGLGWTLNYEMFFYALFLPFLALRPILAAFGVTAALALLAAAGQAGLLHGTVLQTWSNPIVLEFCAGTFLTFLPGRLSLPGFIRLAMAAGALIFLHWQPEGWNRAIANGLPATLLVAAAVTGRGVSLQNLLERGLIILGDASYALYLTHPFVMRAAAIAWGHLHQAGGPAAYVLICLVTSQVAALALHRLFETPSTAWLRARLEMLLRLRPASRSAASP
ncbi:MAG: acyltransferase [Rhodospirillales bacterium]|nr:acyltransferase [Rhodospirillales bacterium]